MKSLWIILINILILLVSSLMAQIPQDSSAWDNRFENRFEGTYDQKLTIASRNLDKAIFKSVPNALMTIDSLTKELKEKEKYINKYEVKLDSLKEVILVEEVMVNSYLNEEALAGEDSKNSYSFWRNQGIKFLKLQRFEDAISRFRLTRSQDDKPLKNDLEKLLDQAYAGYREVIIIYRNIISLDRADLLHSVDSLTTKLKECQKKQ